MSHYKWWVLVFLWICWKFCLFCLQHISCPVKQSCNLKVFTKQMPENPGINAVTLKAAFNSCGKLSPINCIKLEKLCPSISYPHDMDLTLRIPKKSLPGNVSWLVWAAPIETREYFSLESVELDFLGKKTKQAKTKQQQTKQTKNQKKANKTQPNKKTKQKTTKPKALQPMHWHFLVVCCPAGASPAGRISLECSKILGSGIREVAPELCSVSQVRLLP